MSIGHVDRYSIALATAATVVLAACSAGSGSSVPPLALQSLPVAALPFGKSAKDLLYISDSGTNEVETFAWPKPATGAVLAGSFSEPQGECADTKGNVYITNTGDTNVLEFTGTHVANTLSDAGEYPVGCSFDTRDGALAVSNIITTGDGPGSVAIYKDAKGPPIIVEGGVLQRLYFVAYDGSGNLFASGETSSYAGGFAELPAGSKKFERLCPNGFSGGGSIEFPSGLAWDGKYIVAGGQNGNVYRVKGCRVVGTTKLNGFSDIVSFAIVGRFIIGPDAGNASVEIYRYPQGGAPIQTLTGFSEPIGAAVSQHRKGK